MLMLPFIWVSVFSAIYANEVTDKTENYGSSLILYGTKANIKDYPYFASLTTCGAAIISDWWLVTAAHCVTSRYMVNYPVWVGGDDLKTSQRYEIQKVVVHPNHYKSNFLPGCAINDIALLRLRRPLKFSRTVKALALPRENYVVNVVHYFAGLGLNENVQVPKHLMKVDLHTAGTKECLSHLPMLRIEPNLLRPHLNQFKEVAFCARRIPAQPGLCYGDSGSPLVRNNTLVGLASFITNTDCSKCEVGFFTNVAHFVPWIEDVTGIK